MPCLIEDYLYYYSNALSAVALANQLVLAVPAAVYYRLSISGTYRILGQNPNITTAAYKFGIVAMTDAAGQYSITLPYGASETKPTTPSPKWSLVFPDGRIITGVVPADAGPLTIDALMSTYSWVDSNAVFVEPVTAGRLARGSASFSAARTATIVFTSSFAASTYTIKLTPSLDSVTNQVPEVGYSSKSTTGFVINVSDAFSGTVDWEAVL